MRISTIPSNIGQMQNFTSLISVECASILRNRTFQIILPTTANSCRWPLGTAPKEWLTNNIASLKSLAFKAFLFKMSSQI